MNNSNNNTKQTNMTKQTKEIKKTKQITPIKEKEIKRPPPIITNLK